MHSNNQREIRQGLVNYIGALLSSSPYSKEDAKQNVIAVLAEESLNLSRKEDNSYDIYTLKPLLRAVVLILKQRCEELKSLPMDVKKISREYYNTINHLETLIDSIERSDLIE